MSYKVKIQDAYKQYTHDQDKIFPPEVTVRRFKEKLKSVDLDILESTVRIDNGRLDIPVFFSTCGRDAVDTIGTKKQMGKGGTPQQAEASAVMELAERFSFFSFSKNQDNFFTEEFRNLKNHALPFKYIAQSAHDDSSDLDQAEEFFSRLPLKWTWAYNLTRQEEVLIPFNWFYTINEFNGPSAGNCVEEALVQGICEIVERHTSSKISRERLKTSAININSITDPLCIEMIEKYKKEGIRLFITDFSLDTGIPNVGVLAYDPSTFPKNSEIVWTAGTAPDPQKALSRALTEVAQLAGDFNSRTNYVASGLPKFRNPEEADFVMNTGSAIDISSLPNLASNNIKEEVERCIAALDRQNMDVITVNTTHSKLEIPAFYTIVPGAYFRERAVCTSVSMFTAKLIAENGDLNWAISRLKQMDKQMHGKYYIRFYLGVSYFLLDEAKEGLRYLESAMDLGPKNEDIPSIYSYMGQCLTKLGQYNKALDLLKKAEKYDDERIDIYNLMGFCYFKIKEHEEAIKCFKRVIQLQPDSAIDYANIASNFRDMGDQEKAIQYYQISLELDPTIEFAQENLKTLLGGA